MFKVPFIDFQETEVFFPLREFYKDWNKWKSEGAVSGEYGGGKELPSQAVIVFAWASEKHAVLCYPDGR